MDYYKLRKEMHRYMERLIDQPQGISVDLLVYNVENSFGMSAKGVIERLDRLKRLGIVKVEDETVKMVKVGEDGLSN